MFNIYGGGTKFTQWMKNQKLLMNELPVGADVHFFNEPGEDEPVITEVYELTADDGSISKVCDVPNIMLTNTYKIKVHVDAVVYGPLGNAYNVIGNREKYFEVVAAEKPADYVYEETPTKGCGCDSMSGDVSDEQIETAVNKYFIENPIAVVPDGGVAIYAEFVD